MKLIYSNLNESEPQIKMEPEIDLNAHASKQDEEEIKVINDIHHIFEVYAEAFHIKLTECIYELHNEDSYQIEFDISVHGDSKFASMMLIAAHSEIVRNSKIPLYAVYGRVHVEGKNHSSCLVFNAVPESSLDITKH